MHWKLFVALPPAYSNKDTKEEYCHKQVKMIWRKKQKYYEIQIWQCLKHIGSYAELFYQSAFSQQYKSTGICCGLSGLCDCFVEAARSFSRTL